MATLKKDKNSKVVVLLWGPALSGKTVLASQFPNPTFIDLDGQLGSVRAMAQAQGKDFDFPVIPIDESKTEDEDFLEICGKAQASQNAWTKTKKLVEGLSKRLSQDETLVLDNLSRASEYLITHIQQQVGRDTLQIQDWGLFTGEMRKLIDMLHSKYIKCNSILVGHEGTNKDELTGKVLKSLLVPTSMRDRIPSKVSDFLYMTVQAKGGGQKRKIVRTIQSIPDPTNAVGSRSLIPNIESPTFAKMKPYIESYLGRELPAPTWTPEEENLNGDN